MGVKIGNYSTLCQLLYYYKKIFKSAEDEGIEPSTPSWLAYFGLTSGLCCPSSENHATLTGGMENKNQFNSYN